MNRKECVEWIPEPTGQIYDDVDKSVGEIKSPLKVIYTDDYNGGDDNEKLNYSKDGDSGFDLRAQNNSKGGYEIAPGGAIVIPVGIKVATPKGTELQVRTRSGSPIKRGFVVANSPGTVDSGYRGVIGVICHNISDRYIDVECGERIAQGVICPVLQADFIEVDSLDETERGEGAYNSTGVK